MAFQERSFTEKQFVVFGYIRRVCPRKLQVPDEIVQLCALFYRPNMPWRLPVQYQLQTNCARLVSIDLGAGGFAAAYCPVDVPDPGRLGDHKSSNALFGIDKHPSHILLQVNEECQHGLQTVAIGREAQELYQQAVEFDERGYSFYPNIMQHFYTDLDQVSLPLNTLLSKMYRAIMEQAIKNINFMNEMAGLPVGTTNDMFWVVTVPTCCWYSARHMDLLRSCLENAGMKHFTMCADSVAAAFIPSETFDRELDVCPADAPKLLLDCGASTIDIAYIESDWNSQNPKISMCDTLLNCGAHTVGDVFISLLKEWFAHHHVPTKMWLKMWMKQRDLFYQALAELDDERIESFWNVPLVYELKKFCRGKRRQERNRVNTEWSNLQQRVEQQLLDADGNNAFKLTPRSFNLQIRRRGWLYLLRAVLDKLVAFCHNWFSQNAQCVDVLLCGGFSQNVFLQERLKEAFPNKRFFKGRRPHLTVTLGGLHWASQQPNVGLSSHDTEQEDLKTQQQ